MSKLDQKFIDFVLENPKLVTRKESTTYPGLFVIKYSRKVFFNSLWNDILEECRGLVVDNDWNIIVRPFKKIYNRFENNMDFDRDAEVVAIRKVNGFMGAITWDMSNKNRIIYSTTGSLDSDYAVMVEEYLKDFNPTNEFNRPTTWLFEICDPSDPHIIKEDHGAYLIGARDVETGEMYNEDFLDSIARSRDYMRPEWKTTRFSDVVQEVKTCQHEGFVVRNGKVSLKIKSPYYLTKKLFARIRGEKLTPNWFENNKQNIDEEYYPLCAHIKENLETFTKLQEQERISFIEEYFDVK